jgi:hypothetical protein
MLHVCGIRICCFPQKVGRSRRKELVISERMKGENGIVVQRLGMNSKQAHLQAKKNKIGKTFSFRTPTFVRCSSRHTI